VQVNLKNKINLLISTPTFSCFVLNFIIRKMKKYFINTTILFFAILAPVFAQAQDIEARIKVLPSKVQIEGNFVVSNSLSTQNNWSFIDSYADADNLGARISNLNVSDEKGKIVNLKKFTASEFVAVNTAKSFRYEVKTDIPEKITSTAHISWIAENYGLLMLGDLFPQWETSESQKISAKITFELPFGWKIIGNENKLSENVFSIKDLNKAVFLVGKGWREKRAWIGKNELNFAILGEWNFTDDEANQIASQILQEHQRTFGEPATSKSQVFLLPFPKGNYAENWRAETRGATVTIISGVMPFKQQSLQRLHEQLRHELFHFWLPNNLALTGNYDWFYEGFTIYHALRTGIELNYIRFEDFLYTVSQTNNIANAFDRNELTLIDASNNRWRGSISLLYNKGFMVSFLCDLAIIKASKGKRNITDIFRTIWKKYKIGKPTEDGNTAILNILKTYPELQDILKKYVEGKSSIQMQNETEPFGLQLNATQSGVELKVADKLSGKQQDLLDKLGYNNWRKLLQQPK
jgi:predicted metalloprotease with PDZ domain